MRAKVLMAPGKSVMKSPWPPSPSSIAPLGRRKSDAVSMLTSSQFPAASCQPVHHSVRMRKYEEKKVAKTMISDMMNTQIPALRMCCPAKGSEVAICSWLPMKGKSSRHQLAIPAVMMVKPSMLRPRSPRLASTPDNKFPRVPWNDGKPIKKSKIPNENTIGEPEPWCSWSSPP